MSTSDPSSPILVSSGRLEVFLEGVWGSVCSDGFSSTEAAVACDQMGFNGAMRYGGNLGYVSMEL